MLLPFRLILVLLLHVAAQHATGQVPQVGADQTLDVATWNIEWFGTSNGPADDDRQIANVRAVIEQAGIDLWGLQEIADPDDFDALLDALGDGFDGVLATESSQQRIGFIYRTDVLRNVTAGHILTQFDHAFATRPPLELKADVILPDTTLRLAFITVHMKAFGDQESYLRREEAAERLKNHIDFLRASEPIIILGDFNDELGRSIAPGNPSPYENFLDDPARYSFLTLPLDEQNTATYCGNNIACTSGSTLDHVLITDELFAAYEAGSTARFEALLDAFDGTGGACGGEYVCTTSDHLPVYARFRFGTGTAAETEMAPSSFVVEPAYPNPFQHRTTLSVTLRQAGPLRVELIDVLGRRYLVEASARPPGTHRLDVATHALPPGLYFIRLATDEAVHSQRVLKLP